MTNEETKAVDDFEKASAALKKGLTSTKGGSKDESRYSSAYQLLVRLGLRPQIRKKYR